ncbi:hypothetical protein Tco_0721793 [Tanacetum coccineum]
MLTVLTMLMRAWATKEVNAVGGENNIELPCDTKNALALEDNTYFDLSIEMMKMIKQWLQNNLWIQQSPNNGEFQREKIDKTLFIKRHKGDILLVQVYVDDIIFGSTKKELCFAFKKLMHEKYQMSSMRELTFSWDLPKVKTASTLMKTQKPLLKNEDGKEVDVYMYRSMIGSLMYLTSSRPDIMFEVCAYARYQVNPKVSHLHAVKRIFSARNRQWLQIPQHKLKKVVQNQLELGEGSANSTDPHHTPTIIKSSTQPQKTQKHRKPKRKETQVPQPSDPSKNVADEAVHKELGDSLVRASTTTSRLEVEQDSGNITKTRSKATPNESSSQGTNSGGGPRCQKTMRDTTAETSLKRRVKKLEQKKRSRTHGLKRLHKVGMSRRVVSSGDEEDLGEDASIHGTRINSIDANEDISLNKKLLMNKDDDGEITLAQALEALKTSKPKVKVIVFQEPGKSTTTTTISSQQSHDKGKGIMIEEPIKPMKKKDQISFDEETALNLQAEFDEEERLIDADHQLAERLQAQEQEELSDAEKATLFQQLLEKRRRHFAAKKSEEKRNKSPIKA